MTKEGDKKIKESINLPNFLTLLRFALIPFFIYSLIKGKNEAALIIFILGSLTDALDGFVARRFHQITRIGKFIDPAADKTFILTSFLALFYVGMMPWWLFLIAIVKDIVVVSGLTALYKVVKKVELKPTIIGKSSTAFQMTTVLMMLLYAVGLEIGVLLYIVMILTAFLLFYSTCTYVIIGVKMYRESR